MHVLELIETETLSKGGCTYSLSEARMLLPGEPVYIISLHKPLEQIIPVEEFNVSRVKMFLIDNSELLWEDGRVLGTWVYKGNVYLDISTILPKEGTSVNDLKEIAVVYHQLAAWDMELNKEITLYEETNT